MTTHPGNVATEDLFTYAQRISFAGMTERDFSGLQSACRRVYDLMKDGAGEYMIMQMRPGERVWVGWDPVNFNG